MAIEKGDIISISYVERIDGRVFTTNIEQVARDTGIYEEEKEYIPYILSVGYDDPPQGFQNELMGKEVGAKGTAVIPPELAYGERDEEGVHSVDEKELEEDIAVGDIVEHEEYGEGVIVNKIGKRFIVDFNHPLAGREIEYEYEIHEIITDPVEQISRMLNRMVVGQYDISFEDGNGIISTDIAMFDIWSWNQTKLHLVVSLLGRIRSLESLEFREKYENFFNKKLVQEFEKLYEE